MTSLCIVGAGVAGAGAADALSDTDIDVTVLEKSRGVCGRAATRRKNGCRYDHGANYVKDPDDRTTEFVRGLGEEGLLDVTEPVWTFDAAGRITEGDSRDDHKFTWTEGMTQLAKRLFARTDAEVKNQTRVAAIDREGERWSVVDTDGNGYGPFDALLLTPPAPQTAALLSDTRWDDERIPRLREAVGAVDYRTIRTYVLHYPFEQQQPWYGLVNVDKEHDVGWLSREECKEGRVPDGESLLVVQMSPEWSTAHYDDPLDESVDVVAEKVSTLLDDPAFSEPDWYDDQGWRYALPDEGVSDIVHEAEEEGLFFAGDWVAGEARVHAALWNGIEQGERVGEYLAASRL
ncbi:NAD/FAD-dependent oxidoreductase [Salinigranum rubrum]|uniref:NAD/FAD-dependent oxidoreductase n=1 Tax=Salinigranum rubrum TaxID=755307 RepID=A0A2I8VMI5_9EURY|nr:FAD-dependent oxidoreductase [Salinigranum rubrum]AUV83140.1 NAD/FAD-dependent oxidoreductase [Salinigranum rubrum]